jgi:chorismate mutase
MTQDLTTLRQKIDKIDAGILSLLDKRMKISIKISETKKVSNKAIFDSSRERELLANLIEINQETIIRDAKVLEIWGKIIELSREMQEG